MRVQVFEPVCLGGGFTIDDEGPTYYSRAEGIGESFYEGIKFPLSWKVSFYLNQERVLNPRLEVVAPHGNVDAPRIPLPLADRESGNTAGLEGFNDNILQEALIVLASWLWLDPAQPCEQGVSTVSQRLRFLLRR